MPRRDRRAGGWRRRLALGCGAAFAVASSVGAGSAAESLRVPVGRSVSVPLGSPVAKISDTDASVVGYFLNNPDQIEVVGRGTGRSPLRVRLADGTSRVFEVDVVAPEAMGGDPEPIVVTSATAAAYGAAPAAGVAAAADVSRVDDASTLTLAVGESQSFDVTGTATRIDVATAGVIEVERNQPGEVTLIGRSPGETELTLAGSGGAVSRYRIRVTGRAASASGEASDVLSVTEIPSRGPEVAQLDLPTPPPEQPSELPPPPAPAYPSESEIGPLPTNLDSPPPEFVTPEHIGELKKSIDDLRGEIASQNARTTAPAPAPASRPAAEIQPSQIKAAVKEALAESRPAPAPVWRPEPRAPAPAAPPPARLEVAPEARPPSPPPVESPAPKPRASDVERTAVAPEPAPELRSIVRMSDLRDNLLTLGVGRSRVVVLDSPAKRVAVANPSVGDVVLATPSQLVVNGKGSGTTDLVVWDRNDRGTQLKLRVEAQGSTEKQVLLKCKVAEVKRQAMRDLGIDMAVLLDSNVVKGGLGVVSRGGGVLPGVIPGTPAGDVIGSNGTLPQNSDLTIWQPDRGIYAFIQALEKRGVARILAEPNLVAINGQEASFLAGGEVPIPMVNSVQSGELPRVTVEFKEFGVKLNFRPTILDDETISLHVMPEVSSLDYTNGVVLEDFRIPALDTRRAETTVQLHDGQSIVIAGLMMTKKEQGQEKVPWIGDVPVLGALFRSDSNDNSETELVILLTARIVRPLPAGSTPTLAFDRVATH